MPEKIHFTLNGRPVEIETDPERKLLWVIRTDLALTGTKCGCEIGVCGACTVLVDGEAQRSCLLALKDVAGKKVTTIEGLASGEELHPVQQAFLDHGALQCGFCTSGMVLATIDLLQRNRRPTDAQIRRALEGHLCRCSAYHRIVIAVRDAARRMYGG